MRLTNEGASGKGYIRISFEKDTIILFITDGQLGELHSWHKCVACK